jgi:hypothetical protein
MATHRTIQDKLQSEFVVTAAVPMSGAYDMSGVMVQTMLSNAPYDQPGYLAYLVISWNPIYHIYDSIQHALIAPYDTILPALLDGSHGIGSLNNAMPNVPKTIFTSSELDTFVNNLNSPFRLALRANDVYHWKPRCPTRMLFCKADTYVPFMNSVVAIDSMRANGVTNIDTLDVNPTLGHVACAEYAILFAKGFFDQYMTIDACTGVNDPAQTHTHIYPNPARGMLHIDCYSPNVTTILYDMNGRKIQENSLNFGSNTIALRTPAAGVYMIKVIEENGSATIQKLIVE